MTKSGDMAFDIETIADTSSIADLPPVEADSRLKDPEKIRADIRAKEEARISKLGLSPWTGRIAVFGWQSEILDARLTLAHETDDAERDLLKYAWAALATAGRFVTFNGRSFDVPFLLGRSLILGVEPTISISQKKYHVGNHVDIRAMLTNWDTKAHGTLDFFSKRILGRSPKYNMDGSQVQGFWDAGHIQEIADYCGADVAATWDLYQRILSLGIYDI